MELVRYHLPAGGLEWGAAGYALSDSLYTRFPAATIGTSGLTLVVVAVGALLAVAGLREWDRRLWWWVGSLAALTAIAAAVMLARGVDDAPSVDVTIVQGSTPCPFEHCPPDERLRTYQQHLDLTREIDPDSADLVVWSEGSTGATNADPVLNAEVGEAIGAEARRIGAWFLVGGDRQRNLMDQCQCRLQPGWRDRGRIPQAASGALR